MRSRCTAIALAASLCGTAWAQDLSVLEKAYDWPVGTVWDAAWSTGDTNVTEVLSDELSIRVRNEKPEYIALFFERHRIIRFADTAGIVAHARITLPESLDPMADRSFQPLGEELVCPWWFDVRLDHFAARKLRPDGTWSEVGVLARVHEKQVQVYRSLEPAWCYELDLDQVAPGDVVEVRWKYMVPYDLNRAYTRGWRSDFWMGNWSRLTNWRIFFHDELPVRRQRVELEYRRRQGIVLSGERPTGRREDGQDLLAVWEHAGLAGCMDEVNGRPADHLPHIVVRFAPEDLRYWNRDRLSGVISPFPYWMYVLRQREIRSFWLMRVARKTVPIPDKQTQLMKDFIALQTSDMGNAPAPRKAERLHEVIARDFEASSDRLWFLDEYRSLQKLGEQVEEGVLREISRFDLYAKMLYLLRVPFKTAYVMDARVGGMTDQWLSPMWNSEFLFGINGGGRFQWLHPKRMQLGWMADELPFYWAGTPALLMGLDDLNSDAVPVPRFVDLPASRMEENVRSASCHIVADLEAGTATAELTLMLTGQFSTLGRGVFLGQGADSSVLAAYAHHPADAPAARLLDQEVAPLRTDPPFRQVVRLSLDLGDGLRRTEDGGWELDLSGLLMHAVPEGFQAEGRDLPFHWDFPQDDHLEVVLEADRPVEVELGDGPPATVSTSGSRHAITVDRPSERVCTVTSELLVANSYVPVSEAAGLEAVLDGASRMAQLRLVIREALEAPVEVQEE